MLLPLQGASLLTFIAQDDALGYVLVAPSGRIVHNNCGSYVSTQLLPRHFA